MNTKMSAEWEKAKIKIKRYREEHYRDGMLRAAQLVEEFPCRGWTREAQRDHEKLKRVAALIRREADRRGK